MRQWPYLLAGMALVGAYGLAYALRPTPTVDVRSVELERQVPTSFGQWREVRTGLVQMDLAPRDENGVAAEADLSWPYDQTLSRTYARSDGEVVMLALAWGSKQRQEVKIHRPELCYTAQGFQVVRTTRSALRLPDGRVIADTRLVTRSQSRTELVTYWIRIGEEISSSAWRTRLGILEEGLRGRIPDGILVRVSQSGPRLEAADGGYKVQDEFLHDLLSAMDEAGRRVLVGGKLN